MGVKMPFSIVPIGRWIRVVSITAGYAFYGRLTAMELLPHVEIEVLQNFMHGPFLTGAKGSRIMLDRGMAQKILVG